MTFEKVIGRENSGMLALLTRNQISTRKESGVVCQRCKIVFHRDASFSTTEVRVIPKFTICYEDLSSLLEMWSPRYLQAIGAECHQKFLIYCPPQKVLKLIYLSKERTNKNPSPENLSKDMWHD
jgi:hypothetical protein